MPLHRRCLSFVPFVSCAIGLWLGTVLPVSAAAGVAEQTVPPRAAAAVSSPTVQPLVFSGPVPGAAQRPADSPLPADLEVTLRNQLQQLALTSSQQALPGVGRVDIEVGQLDPRLRLSPCQRVEPYLPTGTRLWGRARIGLRCTLGPTPWNVYLPITVKVYGMAWVAAGNLAIGATVTANDLVQGEVDLAEESSAVVSDPEQAIGRSLLRRVAAGQGVRSADLRPRQWFAAGETVKLVAIGAGFSVTASGQAMSAGLEGQSVRVRIADPDNTRSRVVVGQATGDRLVEIRP